MEELENWKKDLKSDATLVRKAQGTMNCRRGRGPNEAIAVAAAVREARGSYSARTLTSSM